MCFLTDNLVNIGYGLPFFFFFFLFFLLWRGVSESQLRECLIISCIELGEDEGKELNVDEENRRKPAPSFELQFLVLSEGLAKERERKNDY